MNSLVFIAILACVNNTHVIAHRALCKVFWAIGSPSPHPSPKVPVRLCTLLRYSLSMTGYNITQVILAFWLVLVCGLSEDRGTIDVIVTEFSPLCFKTSEMHSGIASCPSFLFLQHFDVICDPLLNRCTTTWNLINKALEMQRQAKINDKNRRFGVFMIPLSRRSLQSLWQGVTIN